MIQHQNNFSYIYMINYLEKYIKYKTKYLNLKLQIGGTLDADLLNSKIEKFNKIIQECDR